MKELRDLNDLTIHGLQPITPTRLGKMHARLVVEVRGESLVLLLLLLSTPQLGAGVISGCYQLGG